MGGFGVGLDIVSQICKEYHIKIILDSEPSKGSEFKLLWSKKEKKVINYTTFRVMKSFLLFCYNA